MVDTVSNIRHYDNMESDEDSDGSRVYFKLLAVVLNFYIHPVSLDFGIKHSIGFGTILSQSPEKEFIVVPPHKVLFPPLPYKHAAVPAAPRLHSSVSRKKWLLPASRQPGRPPRPISSANTRPPPQVENLDFKRVSRPMHLVPGALISKWFLPPLGVDRPTTIGRMEWLHWMASLRHLMNRFGLSDLCFGMWEESKTETHEGGN